MKPPSCARPPSITGACVSSGPRLLSSLSRRLARRLSVSLSLSPPIASPADRRRSLSCEIRCPAPEWRFAAALKRCLLRSMASPEQPRARRVARRLVTSALDDETDGNGLTTERGTFTMATLLVTFCLSGALLSRRADRGRFRARTETRGLCRLNFATLLAVIRVKWALVLIRRSRSLLGLVISATRG